MVVAPLSFVTYNDSLSYNTHCVSKWKWIRNWASPARWILSRLCPTGRGAWRWPSPRPSTRPSRTCRRGRQWIWPLQTWHTECRKAGKAVSYLFLLLNNISPTTDPCAALEFSLLRSCRKKNNVLLSFVCRFSIAVYLIKINTSNKEFVLLKTNHSFYTKSNALHYSCVLLASAALATKDLC